MYDVSGQVRVPCKLLTLKKRTAPRPELLGAVPAEGSGNDEGG
jgi:hypothetical protein